MIGIPSTFKISLRALRVNKMRSALTMLGIILGVASVIAMASLAVPILGLEAIFLKSFRLPTTGLSETEGTDIHRLVSEFRARHPEFDGRAFKQKVVDVFLALQAAWNADRWEDARPFETDHLFQTHRYWMERYRKFGLRNHLDRIEVLDLTPCKVTKDAFFDAITVRIKARMVDYTVNKEAKVVGGHRTRLRTFTEYWTFIRGTGRSGKASLEKKCPNCGAPRTIRFTGVPSVANAVLT